MRNFLVGTFLLLFAQNVVAQSYYFDMFLIYIEKNSQTSTIQLINSKEVGYHFAAYNNNDEQIKGWIVDPNSDFCYLYDITTGQTNTDFNLTKINKKTNNDRKLPLYYFEKIIDTIDEKRIETTIFCFQKDNKKRLKRTITITANQGDAFKNNFFDLYSQNAFSCTDFNFSTGLPMRIVTNYHNGTETDYNLTTIKTAKTTLNIPKNN